jgi:uncharacterized membrane protein YdjX (TVP38/TMEM64 family)
MNRLRKRYGEGPLHLSLSVTCLAFAGYLVWIVLPAPNSARIFIWVAVAAAVHDLVLWPLYALLDRGLSRARTRTASQRALVPWINHVRVPVVLSALALLISFPLVLRHSEAAYHTATGLTEGPYLGRWLALTGSAFGASAALYAGRVARAKLRQRPR